MITIKKIFDLELPQNNIEVKGWIKTFRSSKAVSFAEINDGSLRKGLQVIFDNNNEKLADFFEKLNTGVSVKITGDLVESPNNANQKCELQAKQIEVIGESDPEQYPIQKKRASDEFLRSVAHLRPRTNKYASMLRIRAELSFAIHNYFRNKGFFYVHTPIITTSDCEGAGEMFSVSALDMEKPPLTKDGKVDFSKDFFGQKTALTVSGQLEGEAL
ncbi:MAG: amino acid--tRNA ligase-related protein, partial [Elusimicrobiota bacterium]|nr:amino acid--tRNA ligase-related protein [Elusimicrobiota bacterium]